MNIVLDLELKYIAYLDRLSEKNKSVLSEIKGFVSQRISILENEIHSEESDKDAYIQLNLLSRPISITYKGYSKELTNKLESCITNADMTYLSQRLSAL